MPAPITIPEKLRRERIGRNCRRARKQLGISLEDLSLEVDEKLFAQSRQAMHQVEQGRALITPDQLNDLARALQITPQELEADSDTNYISVRITHEVADSKIEPQHLETIRHVMITSAEKRIRVSRNAKRLSRFEDPFKPTSGDKTESDIEELAEKARKKLRLGESPIADLVYSLERAWVLFVAIESPSVPFDQSTVVACSIADRPVVAWYGPHPSTQAERGIFRFRLLKGLLAGRAHKRREEPADANSLVKKLARAILLPRSAVTDAFGTGNGHLISHVNIATLAAIYGLPLSEAIKRLQDLDLLDESRASTLNRKASDLPPTNHQLELSNWQNVIPIG